MCGTGEGMNSISDWEVSVMQRFLEGGIWQVGGKKELSYGQSVLGASICESQALWEFVRLLEEMDF